MENFDIEKLNRENFNALKNALAMPGKIVKIKPFFESAFLAVANVLLYPEVSFFYNGNEDFNLVEAITNPNKTSCKTADYIFSDEIDSVLLDKAKRGDYLNPDFSAALVFKCKNFNETPVVLSGPGIKEKKKTCLPCDKEFIKRLMKKNKNFPLGVEVFFINNMNEMIALSRTTKVEVF